MSETAEPSPRTSVVMCARNAAEWIGAQMDALSRQTYDGDWELVLVDDGSTDDTVAIVKAYADRVHIRVVPTPDPGGQARARNVGSRAARGQLLVYCDADDVADPAWLENVVRAATGCGGVGGHLEEELLNDPVVRQWRPPMTNGGLPGAFGRVHVPVGANCAVWRHVFDEVGGFEETLTFTGDEVDFFWRVQLAGHEVRYAPDAVMHYRHRDTLRGLRGQAYTYGRGNVAVFTRFREVGLPTTSALETVRLIGPIVRGVPRALISRRHRGAWLRMASYFYGQVVESRRRRVWHLG